MTSNGSKNHDVRQRKLALGLLPGDRVRVRPFFEILATLDSNGACEGLPFMPEMARHCGIRSMVLQRVDKACVSASGMQRLNGVVTLEYSRCDGSAHGDCQLRCLIFWKEVWLERTDAEEPEDDHTIPDSQSLTRLRTMREPGVYFCQATELIRACAGYLSGWNPLQYIRDLRSRTFSPIELMKVVIQLLVKKITSMSLSRHAPSQQVNNSRSHEVLNLRVGENVEVKSKKEIQASLDSRGKYRGLDFTVDMYACCGKKYYVKERVERIIYETTGEMRQLKNTVILDGSACDRHRGCGRRQYFLWREIWLRRV